MKKHLFTVPLGEQGFRTYKLRLFAVLLISLFFSSHASAVIPDSAISQNNPEAVIYVSSGTKIIGASDFSNARIIEIPKTSTLKKDIIEKVAFVPASKLITAKRDEIDNTLKIVQVKITKAIKSFYNSIPPSNWFNISKLNFGSIAVINTVNTNKVSSAIFDGQIIIKVFSLSGTKHKFYTSLSYLQLCKFRSSSLRAPPAYS